MLLAILAIIAGFGLLVWSADRFVDGAATTADHAGLPPMLIGMVIVGFGTSAPEMVVSAMAALDGNPDLALGNALGSNIVNIALILGITAIIAPIVVHSNIVKRELPLLLLVVLFCGYLLYDGSLSALDATLLLGGFFVVIAWTVYLAMRHPGDALEKEFSEELSTQRMTLTRSIIWLIVGLLILIGSSRLLVWGAVEIASTLGVSDLIIGLTIVALGTSLPELAASVLAARKGEHDIAIGNIIGSNMFNILAVIGISGAIAPINEIANGVMVRDWTTMLVTTLALVVMAYGFGRQGKITRMEGALLLLMYIGYNAYLITDVVQIS